MSIRIHLSLTTLYTFDFTREQAEPPLREDASASTTDTDTYIHEIRQPTETELDELAAVSDSTTHELRSRFRRGARCAVLCLGPNLATYCWTSFRRERIGESECDISLPSGMAYVWDCATVERYRGRGYYPRLLRWILAELRRQGIVRAWVAAAWSNRSSRRGIVKAGFKHVASILHLCVGERRLLKVIPTASAPAEDANLARTIVQPSALRVGPTTEVAVSSGTSRDR